MSPEARAAAAEIALLRKEMAEDLAALEEPERELSSIAGRWEQAREERPWVVVAAVDLHAWYGGLEAALERVARVIDQSLPAGERSHRELLLRMATDVPGVRPAVVADESVRELEELLKFRHFFRHAYRVQLDPSRVAEHTQRLLRLAPEVRRQLAVFDSFLAQALAEVTRE
ncbi:MAG: hypothetical protein HYZ28_28510 [Myxococcales bacterium]|nr:hypothetical protein [Myxococcales bacterium]